jgi:hypothetical protein
MLHLRTFRTITYFFAASVNNGDVLDNSDIPYGHLGGWSPLMRLFSLGYWSISLVSNQSNKKKISSNACGFDGVFLKFLKLITEYLIDPLTHLVNYFLSTSCFSKHWKKSGGFGLDDLRPFSILPCISKVVERVVRNQLAYYLCVDGVFVEFQSGFHKNHRRLRHC